MARSTSATGMTTLAIPLIRAVLVLVMATS
jgi:hypothetical protein